MALEILVPNSAIRNLIREDKVHQIYSMMQTGQDKYGMQTFNQSLASLYHRRMITLEAATQRSSNADELRELIERGSGVNTGQMAETITRLRASRRQHPAPTPGRPVGVRPNNAVRRTGGKLKPCLRLVTHHSPPVTGVNYADIRF